MLISAHRAYTAPTIVADLAISQEAAPSAHLVLKLQTPVRAMILVLRDCSGVATC